MKPKRVRLSSAIAEGTNLFLKPENLQYTGSFKLRGAGYKIACLTDEEKQKGVIADHGANVVSVQHERNVGTTNVNGCYLRVVLETRNYEHIFEIIEALKKESFKIVE